LSRLAAASLLLLAVLPSCVSKRVGERLALSSKEREREIRQLVAQLQEAQPVRISWQDALKRMRSDNQGLVRSSRLLERSEHLQRKQWLSLVPRVGSYFQISKDLASLSDLSSDDLSARLIANFNIPNPFDFHARLYSAALQQQNSRWSHELDQRRAYIELYSAFMEAEALRLEQELFERRWKVMLYDAQQDVGKSMVSYRNEKDSLERRAKNHRVNVNRLLNTPGANWRLQGGLPRISYDTKYRQFEIGENFGKLALNLYAIRLESAILSTERVKFQQWPVLSFGLSSPPLYVSDQETDLGADNFILFSGVSKGIDFTDLGGREKISDAKFRLKLTRDQLRFSMEKEALRLEQLQKSYGRLLRERSNSRSELEQLSRRESTMVELVLADLARRYQLEMDLLRIERQLRHMSLQYLLWDETYWDS